MRIIFATNNEHKLSEIKHALNHRFELISLREAGFEGEIPETGRTLEANALQKALFIYDRFKQPVFADDTGLEVDCLKGLPGVDTAHYSGSRDATLNMKKLLAEMQSCESRKAKFRTVIALVTPERRELFTGEVEGRIAEKMQGKEGFGYDPLFIPEGHSQTFAEMGMEEKAKMNHRVRALEKLVDYLEKNF